MSIKEMIADAKNCVARAEGVLSDAKNNLESLERDIRNHTYTSIGKACNFIENMLRNKADEDCEGSYCCGLDSYSQDFIVDGKEYIAIMTFEYNRHDKTYYYVDHCEFSYGPKASN
jgi:hypothetical protein